MTRSILNFFRSVKYVRMERMILSDRQKEFNKVLFTWYRTHRREMPWRETADPYKILVSEVMLQQTQVDRVRMKYEEFLKRFPDIFALASAPLSDVLRSWSGLGYNRRARYLHECARTVVASSDGKFPNNYTELVKLPGIGMSTAGALLAFSFKAETPMIDTNIRRILLRVFFANRKAAPTDKVLYEFASTLIPKGKGRDWNYAMLDVGATLCTARGHSPRCPFNSLHGKVSEVTKKYPQRKFEGSRRFYRGRIMRLLVERRQVSSADLLRVLEITNAELLPIIEALISDGLVVSARGRLRLVSQ